MPLLINGRNDAPQAVDKNFEITEDTTLPGNVLIDNGDGADSDIDGDSLAQVQITGLESFGDLELDGLAVTLNQVIDIADINAGKLTFKSAADAHGTGYDSFQFKVHDGTAFSAADYTINIDVTPVNDLPTASDNTVTTDEDVTYTFTAADFDMIRQYRPRMNVVERPTRTGGGTGFQITGHHEIMVPLLAWAVEERLAG